MIDLPPVAPPPIGLEKNLQSQPSFFGAWRGIWLFTWRSQLTWRRLPMALIVLLILPFLVYLTTSPRGAWSPRRAWAADAGAQVDGLSRRLARARLQLQPEQ